MSLQRQRCQTRHSSTRLPFLRTYATMETGQGSSTVTVSPPEILAGKEILPSAPKAILRTDYRPTPYLVSNVHLTFLLGDTTRVKSKLSFVPNYQGTPPALALDGTLPMSRKLACCDFGVISVCIYKWRGQSFLPMVACQHVTINPDCVCCKQCDMHVMTGLMLHATSCDIINTSQ